MLNSILKVKKEDFRVTECISLKLCEKENASYTYLTLSKKGFTTFEAIEMISEILGIEQSLIGYGGLKDEDGITEQTISIKKIYEYSILDKFKNLKFGYGEDKSINLAIKGYGKEEIYIGGLHGNAFTIILRNLDDKVVNNLMQRRKINFLFLNYYDNQRFGLPHKKKVTHLIGKYLIKNDPHRAFYFLKKTEGHSNDFFEKTPIQVFSKLNSRKINFYKNSYSSYLWNNKLNYIINNSNVSSVKYVEDKIPYYFIKNQKDLQLIMMLYPMIVFEKYLNIDEGRVSYRAPVLQTLIELIKTEEDDLNLGKQKCEISFFLPSGSYATTVIKQLLLSIENNF